MVKTVKLELNEWDYKVGMYFLMVTGFTSIITILQLMSNPAFAIDSYSRGILSLVCLSTGGIVVYAQLRYTGVLYSKIKKENKK